MKLDLDTLPTVPDDPPAAGPDRAFEAPPADPGAPPECLPAAGGAAEAEGDDARPTESPITGLITAAAKSNRILFFDSSDRALGRRAFVAWGAEAKQSVEDANEGGVSVASPEHPAAGRPGGALGMGPSGGVSWRVGWSSSFMMALL